MDDLGAPLGVLGGHGHQVSGKGGVGHKHAGVGVPGGEDQGCAAPVGVVQGADAVGQSAGDVDIGEGGLAGGAGVAVGHAHGGALLQGLHVLQLGVVLEHVQQWALAGAGIAEHVVQPLGDEHLGQGLFPGHRWHGNLVLIRVSSFKY